MDLVVWCVDLVVLVDLSLWFCFVFVFALGNGWFELLVVWGVCFCVFVLFGLWFVVWVWICGLVCWVVFSCVRVCCLC